MCVLPLAGTISTLGGLAFVGRILHASGKVLAVAKGLNVTDDIIEVTAAGYQAKKAIDLYIEGDLSEAHSLALQATLRLLGYVPSVIKRFKGRKGEKKAGAHAHVSTQQDEATRALGARGPSSGRDFDPANAGGPIRRLTTDRIRVTQRGVDYTEAHLARFGPYEPNQTMIQRLRDIADGKIPPTQADLNFYSHEMRESVRYRRLGYRTGQPPGEAGWDLWNNAHSATLEDYRIREFDANGYRTLFHPDTWHLFQK